jgi:PEP-CTERM motif
MNSLRGCLVPAVLVLAVCAAYGGSITVTGVVTQDPADAGATAVANPSLNNVLDGDPFTVTLNFSGDITAAGGPFTLTSLLFSDPTAGASEGAFTSGSMTITQVSGMDQFSVLGCLVDPVSCFQGNELDLNFQIPTAGLNQTGLSAQFIPALLPLDLLEDGGGTEIQGSLSGYSYASTAQVPEPSTMLLFAASLAGLLVPRRFYKKLFGGKNV